MDTQSPIIAAWLTWLDSTDAPRRVSTTTLSVYQRHVAAFARWLAETLTVTLAPETATAYRMEAYGAYLRDELQRRPATQAQAIAALSSFGLWLVETKQLGANPARRLAAQPEQMGPPKSLTPTVVKRMLDAAHHTGDLRDALIVELLAFSGMRASEVAGIQINNLERGERSTWIRIDGKGRKIRRIPLPKRVGLVIDSYLDQRSAKDGSRPSTGSLIVGIRGAITRLTIDTTVARVAERAALSPEKLSEKSLVAQKSCKKVFFTLLRRWY